VTQRPELTIKEAATSCGVSDKTIRRNLKKFPNAHRLDAPSGPKAGPWVIPVTDLLAAGYQVGRPSSPEEPQSADAPPSRTDTEANELRKRIEELEQADLDREREIAKLRTRAEVAEAIATERSQALDDVRLALRALEAGPAQPASIEVAPEENQIPAAVAEQPAAKGWLSRKLSRLR